MCECQRKPNRDWHKEDIKAALHKRGYSLNKIARKFGYCRTSPATVLRRPWAVMEKITADIIGVHPSEIWPSRYDEHGEPLKVRESSFARVARHKKAGNA